MSFLLQRSGSVGASGRQRPEATRSDARNGGYSRRALTPSERRLYGLSERTVEFAANRRE